MQMSISDLKAIAEGAAFLGTGGGGDPYMGRLVSEQSFNRYGVPQVISVDDLDDNANVYLSAFMGAPSVMLEKIIGTYELGRAINALENYTGLAADAILPAEMGGCNSMAPLAIAAERGLPVINADGMGRAFPELQMTTFNVLGVNASPMAIANEHGEVVVIDARDSKATEDKARSCLIDMGANVAMSLYPRKGKTVKKTAVAGTLELAKKIGNALHRGRDMGNPLAALLDCLQSTDYYRYARCLFTGKVVSIDRNITDGFTKGLCRIRGREDDNRILILEFQNEHLIARVDNEYRAMLPDLICVIDQDTGTPITTEGLKYGQRVHVIAASVPPIMRSKRALAVFGPRAFGYDTDFVPIEELMA